MTDAISVAYSATGGAWQAGPGPIYDRLAEVVVESSPVPLGGCRVLDVGAGTGAATRAALAAGAAAVVAVDPAVGMLANGGADGVPAVAGDARTLPFAAGAFDAGVAAFSLTHLDDPAAGLAEMLRVTRPGGAVMASSYTNDDSHPVKAAVEATRAERGWTPEPWYAVVRRSPLGSVDGFLAAAAACGVSAEVDAVRVPFPNLLGPGLVAWRLGMAQHARFLAGLGRADREAVAADALSRLGPDPPPLVRSIVVLRAVRP